MNEGHMIYRGGVTTLVSNLHVDMFTMDSVRKMLNGWGFNEGTYRVWTKIIEIDSNHFQIRKDDDCYDLAAFSCANEVEGHIFVEHDVIDTSVSVVSPRCVNETVEVDNWDEDGVEGLGDSEDERATGLMDGFEEIDFTVPIREAPSMGDYMRDSKNKKWKMMRNM
jgi:hypothetical protein